MAGTDLVRYTGGAVATTTTTAATSAGSTSLLSRAAALAAPAFNAIKGAAMRHPMIAAGLAVWAGTEALSRLAHSSQTPPPAR